jgi:hypothetical protein
VLSIPYTGWRKYRSRRQEQRFEEAMRIQGRTMPWGEFEVKRRESSGCLLVEWLSFTGPTRWWWLDEGIRLADDLLKVEEEDSSPDLYVPLDMERWEIHYTGRGGKAVLICGTSHEKRTLMDGPFRFKDGVHAFLVAPFLAQTSSRSS